MPLQNQTMQKQLLMKLQSTPSGYQNYVFFSSSLLQLQSILHKFQYIQVLLHLCIFSILPLFQVQSAVPYLPLKMVLFRQVNQDIPCTSLPTCMSLDFFYLLMFQNHIFLTFLDLSFLVIFFIL